MKRIISLTLALIILGSAMLPMGAAAQATSSRGTLEGYITRIDEIFVELETYRGERSQVSFDKDVLFIIDDTPAQLRDFKPGMEVYAKYRDYRIYRLEGYSTENPGFISPGGKVRSGIVKKIDRDQILLRLTTGEEESFFTAPGTIIVKNGKVVPLGTLYEGDSVRLFFDEIDTAIISRMHIQGYSEKIQGLYRGTLEAVDGVEDVITLKNVEVFSQGDWQKYKEVLRLEYSGAEAVFMAGAPVPQNHLKYLRGKTVYAAVKDFFGREKIEKLVVKHQHEATYSEKIKEINWYADSLELENRRNFGINDGTIFIKGERLVDKDSIAPGSDAYIIADGRGSGANADVVYVYSEDMNNSTLGQNYLYAGRLDMVVENLLSFEDFYLLNRNEWESFRKNKELYYDDDTYIYDGAEQRRISSREFYSGDYAIDEDSRTARRKDLKSWHGYAYTDGDRAVAIVLMEDMDSLLRQRITLGIVDRVEEDPLMGHTVILREARDWSSRNDAWMPKSIPVRLRVEKTITVKNNEYISYEDIRPGDMVYCVREDNNCKFLLIK